MNIKTIIVGSLALGCVIGGAFFKMNTSADQAAYTPRSIQKGDVQGIAGYAEYMKMLRADPATGEIDVELVEQTRRSVIARSQLSTKKSGLGLNWNQAGPDNVGGRTRAVLVDQSNSNIVYAGSIAGGLFVSNDGALSWSPVASMQGLAGENLVVSCITQTDNGRIFFGTGTTFDGISGNGGSGFLGNGVYEYVPATGAVLPVATNSNALPNNSFNSTWTATNIIAHKGNRLYVGTRSGMYWADATGTNDANGNSSYPTSISGWTNPIESISGILETNTCQDIDVASDGSMVVCFGGKVYTSSSDALGTFSKLSLSGSRISAAIAPNNPNVYYFIQADNSGKLIDMQISLDKGAAWSIIIPDGSPCIDPFVQNDCTGGQGKYDMAIAVDPMDWGHVIVGGVQLYEFKYTPGSNPIGGSWLKSATLNEFSGNNIYMHADKHTIFWSNEGTVYVGHDGGVSKSIDNGGTWRTLNYGYNVTTFYDATMSADGWIVGGAQDNGTQLQTFGVFGTQTPLGTVEIQGGDGFDCAFSSFGSGIVYATSQNGSLSRSTPGGSMGTFFDNYLAGQVNAEPTQQPFHTVIENWENANDPLSIDSINLIANTSGYYNGPGDTIFAGDTVLAGKVINYSSLTNAIALTYTVPSTIVLDSIVDTLRIVDPLQNRFVIRMNNGCYLTKDAARLNATEYKWFKISNESRVENFEFSPDGNSVYLGTSNGKVYRVSGLASVNKENSQEEWDAALTVIQIGGGLGGGSVVSLAIDPNNGDNLIATAGGYSSNPHVYRSINASTATSTTGTFEEIQGVGNTSLPFMPVYDAEIDYSDNNKVVIGTEWGVWSTDNAFSALNGAGVEWTDESGTGMAHVPVFAVEQQHLSSYLATNSGYFYLGTHARGFYYASDLAVVSVEEENGDLTTSKTNKLVSNVQISPNPLNTKGQLTFDLMTNGEATVKVFNLKGSLVKTMNLGMKIKGENKEEFNAASLSVGTYILSLEANGETSVAKFIVTR
jgi:hypothetical protein